jgi:methyltransferase (TIGR00027 family)
VDERSASRTAVLTCQGRAVAQGRLAVGRFDDPTAMALLRPDEREPVERARAAGPPPDGWSARMGYERMRAAGELMAARTVVIDDAIAPAVGEHAVAAHDVAAQVVVLGAGLDGRAWRMPELADALVFEVDHPASQRDKVDRLGAFRAIAEVRFVAADLARDDLRDALEDAGHRSSRPTTWVWEGVVPYLTSVEVEGTVRAVRDRSSTGSRLVVNYQAPSVRALVGRRVASLFGRFGLNDPMADEPWRSAWRPDAMAELLVRHGFAVVGDDDMASVAIRLGVPFRSRSSMASSRVAIATRR